MELIRDVQLENGAIRGVHRIIEVTASYADSFTRLEVESSDAEGLLPTVVSAVVLPLADGMDEEAAYDALSEAWPEYVDKGEILNNVLDMLTDEQAETVPQLYPEWAVDTFYAVGKRVRYEDKLYRCEQAHTSQEGYEPAVTPALWTRTAAEGEILEWVQPTGAQDAYEYGAKVTHNGKTWISTYEGKNVWEPGVFGWEEVTQ